MLRKRPGVFVAGEMIDWEAPTGRLSPTGRIRDRRSGWPTLRGVGRATLPFQPLSRA